MATETAEERLKQLESLFSYGGKEKGSYSVETLLDVLLLLYDECCNSTLRRDKNVSEFIEHGKKNFISVRTEVFTELPLRPVSIYFQSNQWQRK